MHLTKVTSAILFALTQTSESSLLWAGLDPMISKAVFFLFSVSRKSTEFVWVHWFSLQGHLCHVASLQVILWNHGELICGSCHNIYLASGIPLLLGAFIPLDRSVWWFLEKLCYSLSIRSVNSPRPYKQSMKTTFSLLLRGQLRCPYPKIQHPWREYFRNVSLTGQFTSPQGTASSWAFVKRIVTCPVVGMSIYILHV